MDPGEECDDGNALNTDECLNVCLLPTCGDGFVRESAEECDDGNLTGADGCSPLCMFEVCGNGVVDPGEACDDGNLTDADGCDADCTISELACYTVEPLLLAVSVDGTLTVHGLMFDSTVTLLLTRNVTGDTLTLTPTTIAADGTALTVDVAAGTIPDGTWAVQVVGATVTADCPGWLRVTALDPPTVLDVVPAVAWEGLAGDGVLSDETVTIVGTDFRITPVVRWTLVSDASVSFESSYVVWISATQLVAVCPSESERMPPGDYYVDVINPEGLGARWLAADGTAMLFEVTTVPGPMITAISPERGAVSATVALTVSGNYFQSGAEVSFELPDGTRTALATTFVSANELQATVPATVFVLGLYPVWVTNPDGREDVYYVYQVTESAAGHFNAPFETVDGSVLATGRERLDAVHGFDVYGGSHLYAVGGIDAADAARDDVERAPVTLFGTPGVWAPLEQWGGATSPRVTNVLSTPRNGVSVVRVGAYLYAMGGSAADTNVAASVPALATVERAQILGYDTMPRIRLPIARGGSGLPFGTWYYRVTAVGPWGESLPSQEMQVLNASGVIDVCWHPVTGATGYNVYRNPAADGRAGTVRLLAAEVAAPCFADDGRGDEQPAPGHLAGTVLAGGSLALGTWIYRVTAVVGGRETLAGYREFVTLTAAGDQSIHLDWDPVPGATYNLYRSAAAVSAVAGDEATFLLVADLATDEYTDDGALTVDLDLPAPDGVRPLPPGSLGRWTAAASMVHPREGADAVALTVPSGTETDPDHTYIYVVGGRPSNSGTGYHRTTERAEVLADGTLGAWAVETSLLNTARAFFPLLTSWNRDVTPYPPPPEERPCDDLDGDGHDAEWCGGDDCDDTDPDVHPGATELCGDGIDQDCDGIDPSCDCTSPDVDGDGYDRPECGGDDCDDTDPDIHPGAVEVCGDGIDQDCDGFDLRCDCPVDADGDGHDVYECGGDDCDDTDPDIHPGAVEILCDGIDQNCDGLDDCLVYATRPAVSPIDWSRRLYQPTIPETRVLPLPVPRASLATEPIYLIACQGDDAFTTTGGGNTGLTTFEIVPVTVGTGALGSWTTQTQGLPAGAGRAVYGHGAFVFADYVFVLPGVSSERLGDEPTPQTSTVMRFPFDIDATDPAAVLGMVQSSASTFADPRGYYGYSRLNGTIFAIGGNDGTGPIDSLESIAE